jgi:tetratricopeptide (TPR) repeat protein
MPTHYHAFISYSHADDRWARWLQSALESYRLPGQLARERLNDGAGSNRLFPIFRDRDELASSSDLSQSIRTALQQSSALIVVCSPAAAQSKWVNEEIRQFRHLGRADQIHCLLVDGSPERGAEDCAFPAALLECQDGQPLPEPLAADVRIEGDGKRGAILKIAAGLLNVGIDTLRQRDAQKQLRRRGIITAVSVVIAVITLALAVLAQIARDDADLRRGQAEGLINFMLGDLRDRLEPLGRLDLLDSVGDEALQYFDVLGDRGTEKEVFSRVMALRQIGEVRFRQGQYAKAEETFAASRDLAEHLHASLPDRGEYLFELGQAEFWVGYAALEQADLEQAEISFGKYMEYTRRLLETDPDNADYQLELSYAYSNLGTVSLDRLKSVAALDYFEQSATLNQTLADASPDDVGVRLDLGNGYSWIGAAQLELGRLKDSEEAYRTSLRILTELDAQNDSPLFSENRAQNAYHLGNVLLQQGNVAEAGAMFQLAGDLLESLVRHDPENAVWRVDRAINAYHQGEFLHVSGDMQLAREHFSKAAGDFTALLMTDPGNTRSAEHLALTERSLSLIDNSFELIERAHARMRELLSVVEAPKPRTVFFAATVAETYGRALTEVGDGDGATAVWTGALRLLRQAGNPSLNNLALEYTLLTNLGDTNNAEPISQRLDDAGYKDPRFLSKTR